MKIKTTREILNDHKYLVPEPEYLVRWVAVDDILNLSETEWNLKLLQNKLRSASSEKK